MTRDQDGNPVHKNIEPDTRTGWRVTVWFGTDPATDIRRYVYLTRAQARRADISDDIGIHGRIG
tara:strand:- start:4919 stop:5110 length:192 start_codon:yes stop_codon:yes gene_type:complete